MSTKKSGFRSDPEWLNQFFESQKNDFPDSVKLTRKPSRDILYLQFTIPQIYRRQQKNSGEKYCESGIVSAKIKAQKIAHILSLIASGKFAVSEFDTWYNAEILGVSEKQKLLTYREIIQLVEDKYFSGKNRNTGRKRTKNGDGAVSDLATFETQYGKFFAKFPDWDGIPTWGEIWNVWQSWRQGTKTFSDMKTTVKAIVKHMPNCDELIKRIDKIDCTQTEFKEKQFIGLDEFLNWHDAAYAAIPSIKHPHHRKSRESWLWVASMAVLYGLRPSEIAAAQNLTEPFTLDGVTVYPLTDRERNPDCTLVVGEFTYFGASTKTGLRPINPIPDNTLIERLKIRDPKLPEYHPRKGSRPSTVASGFDQAYSARLESMKCPISQKYAFRHLYNLLGELSGWPQEYRARNMGHTESANNIYKKRFDFKAAVQLVQRKPSQP